jgi:hypothetical protein
LNKGGERLIVRGNTISVRITEEQAAELAKQGYKWSGHTHPGVGDNPLLASDGDMKILNAFGQNRSVIYNSSGKFQLFDVEG